MGCGIYAIVCNKTWRAYVGQTKNLETRFKSHINELRNGPHYNSELQKDFDLYGESSFSYELIEEVLDEKQLGQREVYWINFGENLYNKTNPSHQLDLNDEEIKRFWSYIDIKSENECWNWIGAKDKDGYGRIGFHRNKKKRTFRANRIAYFLKRPQDDINLLVRHTCHNSKCCNPSHLIIGTYGDNTRDLIDKENNHYQLNWDVVDSIRQKFQENPKIKGKEFVKWCKDSFELILTSGYIIKVALNEFWYDPDYQIPVREVRYCITQNDLDFIKNEISDGKRHMQCVKNIKQYNKRISKTTALRIIKEIKNGDI